MTRLRLVRSDFQLRLLSITPAASSEARGHSDCYRWTQAPGDLRTSSLSAIDNRQRRHLSDAYGAMCSHELYDAPDNQLDKRACLRHCRTWATGSYSAAVGAAYRHDGVRHAHTMILRLLVAQ
jgi:hypothetical protein